LNHGGRLKVGRSTLCRETQAHTLPAGPIERISNGKMRSQNQLNACVSSAPSAKLDQKACGFVPIRSQLEQVVKEFGDRLKYDFADQILHDPAGFRKLAVRLIRRQLPPRRSPMTQDLMSPSEW
jgi:hypothetical protein